MLPPEVLGDLVRLPLRPPMTAGPSGRREYGNEQRVYFDRTNMARFPVMQRIAQALQSPAVVSALHATFGAPLDRAFLRIEYALDIDGFWLEPHTDLGVKVFTMLLYLSKDESHKDLGTDIYDSEKQHFGRSPFTPNAAMVFVPGNNTYHGFEKRQIKGVRTSLIINYVTNEWRAREQLSFPDAPIA